MISLKDSNKLMKDFNDIKEVERDSFEEYTRILYEYTDPVWGYIKVFAILVGRLSDGNYVGGSVTGDFIEFTENEWKCTDIPYKDFNAKTIQEIICQSMSQSYLQEWLTSHPADEEYVENLSDNANTLAA